MTTELLEKANELEKEIKALKDDLKNFERFNKEEGNCYFEKNDNYVRVPAEVMQECAALAELRMKAILKEKQEEFEKLGNETPQEEKQPEPYNGKVVCVDLRGQNGCSYTEGKIYQFKDGYMTDDVGYTMPKDAVYSFEEWQKFTSSKFIEIVE